ncbi:mitochondrial substrate carrier family protein L-like [Mya arenaria]|uniref:mitochondrial substrate carrier family protein L-like n=1 Tax=Mya arenaria TaxID=6604 RepID=UPI0022E35802|nr:mitochondrial substrate carrier family protein L-like [Mya arenaria]XP_052777994.1 mitochondrial substrate carrier family protein L-like [Mya arenaria]
MTHSEKRTHWFKEGGIGLGVGILYGLTNTCVGHPWDTLKTKMQAQAGFEKTGLFQTLTKTLRSQGVIGLYRGCIPPLWGSGIYRSVQFAVFEGVYTLLNEPNFNFEIPLTAGLQPRVIIAGAVASTSRAIIETPLEFAKIKRQTQQTWELRKVYTGFGVTWLRTMGLMSSYFIFVDTGRRNFPEYFARPILGPFLISGMAATMAWWIVWPLEYMKSQVQSGYANQNESVLKRMATVIRERGFFSLYRGILPGTIRSFTANGTSMVVMTFAQRKVSEMGLRD